MQQLGLWVGRYRSIVKGIGTSGERNIYSATSVAASCLFATAEVETFCTIIPKLPLNESAHLGGGAALGDITAVSACGTATGFAWTAATKNINAREIGILRLKGRNINSSGGT